jgi:hypothetical protein
MTKIFTFLVGQSCCSALKSWQRRPAKDSLARVWAGVRFWPFDFLNVPRNFFD